MLIEITLLRHERGSEIAHSECLPWECRRVVTIIIMIIILIIIMIIIMITIMIIITIIIMIIILITIMIIIMINLIVDLGMQVISYNQYKSPLIF